LKLFYMQNYTVYTGIAGYQGPEAARADRGVKIDWPIGRSRYVNFDISCILENIQKKRNTEIEFF
jgi:hypothetical protein